MSTKELTLITSIAFLSGLIACQVIETNASATTTIPILSMIGAYLGFIFNRIKHIDDLNLSRKKEVCLEFISYMSKYRSTLISIIEPTLDLDEYYSSLRIATKNMVEALDKLHVVCKDHVSSKIELKIFELSSLMIRINQKSTTLNKNKEELTTWMITKDILSELNLIRYEIIHLINSEIGDESKTTKLKQAIEKNNKDFKSLLLEQNPTD